MAGQADLLDDDEACDELIVTGIRAISRVGVAADDAISVAGVDAGKRLAAALIPFAVSDTLAMIAADRGSSAARPHYGVEQRPRC